MDSFTRLEQHFLLEIQRRLADSESLALVADVGPRRSPELLLTARMGELSQPVRIQVHGVRPVRYHVFTANTNLGHKIKSFLSRVLGPGNLVKARIDEQMRLTYHVDYPENVTKTLGG